MNLSGGRSVHSTQVWYDDVMTETQETPIPFNEFAGFGHIYRLTRECIVTEKIDGTNAQIIISDTGEIRAGSSTRFITPEQDNAGFAKWVKANEAELVEKLGPGQHFGEWWGQGIQRTYGIKEKRFSLFNTTRWNDETKPSCCHIVPVLYQGLFLTDKIDEALASLETSGSIAAPGFMKPEGIVIYHVAGNHLYKKTLGGDGHKFQNAK